MPKYRKTLDKLRTQPPSANIKWDELRSLLEHLGYAMLSGSGSRRKFYHKENDALIHCHVPHPSPDVDKGAISAIADHLEAYGFFK